MHDSLNVSVNDFFVQFWKNTWAFIQTLGSLIPVGILFLVATLNNSIQKSDPDLKKIKIASNQPVIFFVLIEFLLFLLLLGYYSDRLTFSLLPILLCLLVIHTGKKRLTSFTQLLFIIVALGWHSYIMLWNAPHFSDYYFYR